MFAVRWRRGKLNPGRAGLSGLNLRRGFCGTLRVNASRIVSHARNYLPSHDNAQVFGDLDAVAKLAKDNPKTSRIMVLSPNDGEHLDMEKLVHRTMQNASRSLGPIKYAFAVHEKGDKAHFMNRHAHVIAVFDHDHSKQKLWPNLRREMRIEATKQLGGMEDHELAMAKELEVKIGKEVREHMGESSQNGMMHEYPSMAKSQETWRGREKKKVDMVLEPKELTTEPAQKAESYKEVMQKRETLHRKNLPFELGM